MNTLAEEYSYYQELIAQREKLDGKLLEMSDSRSLEEKRNISEELEGIIESLKLFDRDLLNKIDNYYETKKEFERICDEIRTVEKLSNKSKGEKVVLISSEGRKKEIDKDLAYEYKLLADYKKRIRRKFVSEYQALKNVTSVMKKTEEYSKKLDSVIVSKENDELSLEEKILETKNYLETLFASSLLPNQGKKEIVTYEGRKRVIASKYRGKYNEGLRKLSHLMKISKEKEAQVLEEKVVQEEVVQDLKLNEETTQIATQEASPKKEEVMTPLQNFEKKVQEFQDFEGELRRRGYDTSSTRREREEFTMVPLTLPYLNDLVSEKRVELSPIKVNLSNPPRVSLAKAVTTMKKASLEKIKKILSNLDKKVQYGFLKGKEKVIGETITILDTGIKFKNGAKMTINRGKSYVLDTSKRIVKYFADKRELASKRKDLGTLRAMEEVYQDKKNSHLDYIVVNRYTKFKEDTCLRIDETKGVIGRVTKNSIDKLKLTFDRLRVLCKDDIERRELEEKIKVIQAEILQKQNELKRLRVKESSGYIGMGAIITLSIIALAAAIFTAIGNIIVK